MSSRLFYGGQKPHKRNGKAAKKRRQEHAAKRKEVADRNREITLSMFSSERV